MHENSHIWYIILIIIIVLSAVGTFGFLYYTTSHNNISYQPLSTTVPIQNTPSPKPTVKASPSGDPSVNELMKTSSGDDIESIGADIKNTKIDTLDQELPKIEESLQ